MTTRKKSPAKKEFCVWADRVERVYQNVESVSPKRAYEVAKTRIDWWEPCEEHDSNTYRLSNEVQDLATERFIAIHGTKNCKTCGSEIVETINDSNFRDGECGPCEYRRYRSQPDLFNACCLARREIEQWDQIMGGSDDPRTKKVLAALQAAFLKAHGTAN